MIEWMNVVDEDNKLSDDTVNTNNVNRNIKFYDRKGSSKDGAPRNVELFPCHVHIVNYTHTQNIYIENTHLCSTILLQ